MKRVESDASQIGDEKVEHAEDYSVSPPTHRLTGAVI